MNTKKRKSNTFRCFKVLECLKKNTNSDIYITTNEIKNYLYENYNISANRKTIYADIKTLNEVGYDISSNYIQGFHLNATFFEYGEIKILSDAINSSNFLDKKYRQNLNNKLFSLISDKDAESLNRYEYLEKRRTSDKTKYYLNDIIEAIKNNQYLYLEDQGNIIPYHLHRHHDRYYLIYQYEDNDKVYFKRVDRIKKLSYSFRNINENKRIKKEKIIKILKEQIDMYQQDIIRVHIKINIDNDKLKQRTIDMIYDEFTDIVLDNNGNYIVNGNTTPIFFSHLIKFKNNIKIIKPKSILNNYHNFLNDIIKAN